MAQKRHESISSKINHYKKNMHAVFPASVTLL